MKLLKFKMWKASWVILVGFLILFSLDIVSTTSAGELVKYMETNIIFIYFGWFGLILINLFVLWIILKAYDQSIHNSFMALNAFVWVSLLRIAVIINNFKIGKQVQSGEITKAMVEGVSTTTKVTAHAWMVGLQVLLPLIVTMVIFYLFRLDHNIEKR